MTSAFKTVLVLCVTFVIFDNVYASKLPSVFTPCHKSDPEINACMKAQAQIAFSKLGKGLPEVNLKQFEPFKLGDIKREFGQALKFDLRDIEIHDIADTVVVDFKWNPKKQNLKLSTTNTGYMKSKYKADGRLIVVPVQGEGDFYIKLNNVMYNYTLPYDVVKGSDGKDYWKLRQHRYKYLPETVTFELTNLFNGNQLLADQLMTFMNANWKDILSEVGAPVMDAFIDGLVEQMRNVFNSVPVEDFLLP